MSMGKMPGIKGLVSGSQTKRRFKSELSVDMISPPLGDFRHTMHVGRGGDVFGDTSFLSNYGGSREPGSPDSASSSRTTGFFTRTFRNVGKNGPRGRSGSRDLSSPPPDISPIIKNAISLPQLNVDSPNGILERALFPSSISATDDSFYTYGLQSGFVTLPRLSHLDRHFQDAEICRDGDGFKLKRSDSLTSFHVDLGPSLMAEMLDLFDNPSSLSMSARPPAADQEEKEEDEEESGSLTPVQSPAETSPNISTGSRSSCRNMSSRGRSHSSIRTDRGEEVEERRSADASPASPPQKEVVMEAKSFHRAAEVLSRHYGGSFTKRSSNTSFSSSSSSPAPCSFRSPPPTQSRSRSSPPSPSSSRASPHTPSSPRSPPPAPSSSRSPPALCEDEEEIKV